MASVGMGASIPTFHRKWSPTHTWPRPASSARIAVSRTTPMSKGPLAENVGRKHPNVVTANPSVVGGRGPSMRPRLWATVYSIARAVMRAGRSRAPEVRTKEWNVVIDPARAAQYRADGLWTDEVL